MKQITATTRRISRVRGRIRSVSDRPRLSVERSNKHIYAQIIDDKQGKTVVSASDAGKKAFTGTKNERSQQVGQSIAELALKKGVKQVVFDRGDKAFHGRIKTLAEAARSAGLDF